MTTVTCAIIEKSGNILIARRAADQKLASKWEFPGGKVEDGESPEEGKPWGRILGFKKTLKPKIRPQNYLRVYEVSSGSATVDE